MEKIQVESEKVNPIQLRKNLRRLGIMADLFQWGGMIVLFIYEWKLATIVLFILLGFALRTYGHVSKTVYLELNKLINKKPNDKTRISTRNIK